MEYIIGVSERKRAATSTRIPALSEETIKADIQYDEEGYDAKARERYQRLFWEPVVEGKVGISATKSPFLTHFALGAYRPGDP